IDRTAVEIDRDDVVGGQRATHRGAGVDVERRSVAPHAAMSVVIDVLRTLQHANGIDEVLFDGLLGLPRHVHVTCCLHASHARPTVCTLTISAMRPSSASSAAIGPPNACA